MSDERMWWRSAMYLRIALFAWLFATAALAFRSDENVVGWLSVVGLFLNTIGLLASVVGRPST